VTSLAVAFEELPFLDANGNLHLERSSAVVNGNDVSMTDVYFNVDVADVTAAGLAATTMAQLIGQSAAIA
jgi:serine-aspartate repeat-containing protein C/D/E